MWRGGEGRRYGNIRHTYPILAWNEFVGGGLESAEQLIRKGMYILDIISNRGAIQAMEFLSQQEFNGSVKAFSGVRTRQRAT